MNNPTRLEEDVESNYERFLAEALELGCVWGLESDLGWAVCPSHINDELEVLPLWSQPEFAQVHVDGEWSEYKVIPIAIDELMDDWIPGMHEDVTLVGPNWNTQLEGLELEPLDLLEDLDELISEG